MISTKVAHMPLTLSSMEFQLAHGASKFLKGDKVSALKRQEKSSTSGLIIATAI
jgi:hypothetical protein